MGKLHYIDIFVLFLYFAGMIGVSIYYYRKIKDSDSFAVADRSLSMPIMIGTTVATCIGAATAFGQVGMVNRLGAAGLYSIFGWHIGWIALVAMAKPLRESGAYSLPQFLNIKYGLRAKQIAGVVSLVFLINATAAQIAAVGTIFEALGLSVFKVGAIIGGIAIIIYTIFGGLYAVSVTDTIQAVLLFFGVAIAVPIIAFSKAGGVAYVFSNLGPEKLNWTDFNMAELLPLTLGYVLAAGSHAAYSQRIFASKDVHIAHWGSIISNGVALVIQTLIAISALTIPFIFPDMANGEMLVPAVIVTYMPPVLTGLVLAALIGVVLSTADSFLLLLGTTFANDVIHAIKPDLSNAQVLKISRISTFIGGVLCIFLALYGGSVLKLFTTGAAAYGAGMFFPLILGCFWRDASTNGVIVGAFLCLASIIVISLVDKSKKTQTAA